MNDFKLDILLTAVSYKGMLNILYYILCRGQKVVSRGKTLINISISDQV